MGLTRDRFEIEDGGKLYFEIKGEGHPLVLIHAGFLDSRMWDREFEFYAKQYKVIRYDVRGFGKSSLPKEKFSDSKDLFSLLKWLGVERTYLLGVSNGGRIAFDFITEHPEMVDALIVVGTGIRGYEPAGPEEEKVWDEFDAKMKPLEAAQEKAVRELRLMDAVRIDVDLWAAAQSPESYQHIWEIAMDNAHTQLDPPGKLQVSPEPLAFKRLGDIKVPTLFIIGDKDVSTIEIVSRRLNSMIPGSKLVLLQGADHIANMSRPEEFSRTVLEFLHKAQNILVEQSA